MAENQVKGMTECDIYIANLLQGNAEALLLVYRLHNFIRDDLELKSFYPSFVCQRLRKHLSEANKMDAFYVIIIGEDEMKGNYLTVRSMLTYTQKRIPIDNFENEFREYSKNILGVCYGNASR